MDLRTFSFLRGITRTASAFCLALTLVSLYAATAFTQSQSASPQSQDQSQQPQTKSGSNPTAPAQTDDAAAAKAAERKRKFEEQRQLVESGYSSSKESRHGRVDPDLRLMPMEVNLLVHDRVQFHLFDKDKEVEGASWSAMPGRIVASWFQRGIFTIEAKSPGTAQIAVATGSRHTYVMVTVYPGTTMPKGVERSPEVLK
jgi:hypothetical protein